MSAPDFSAVRNEISDLFDGLVSAGTLQLNLPHMPLALGGVSPVLSTENAGMRAYVVGQRPGEFNVSYRLVIRVNREAHGAEDAANVLDDVRQAVIDIVIDDTATYTNFDALLIPAGQFAPVFHEIIDGLQYVAAEIPVTAQNAHC